jgi:nucleolar protein 56
MSTLFLLYESASGYGLFEVTSMDEIGQSVDTVQQAVLDVGRFGKAVKLAAFKPFSSAANALENINAVSESQVGGFDDVELAICTFCCPISS